MSQPFSGGIAFPHDVENKAATSALPIENFTPARLVIPLRQGFGAACVPVVDVGQTVKKGQLVGRPSEDGGTPVHCGISGTVRALSPMPVIGGEEVLCVTVENDSFHTPEAPLSWNNTPEGIVCLMADAGLVGMGGAGFPTAVKFSTDKPIHQVLINGCECEPYLTCDHRLMLQEAEKVIKGAQAMGRVVEAAVTICVENNKPDAVTALEQAARDADVKVLSLPARYPQGGERQLIQAVTGLEVPDGKLPADVGVLVSNVATAAALADAMDGTPLTHRIVTVSGQVNRPANLRVPIGTLLADLLAHCGGIAGDDGNSRPLYIAGGPMTGTLLERLDVPVTKTTGGLLAILRPENTEQNCIRCGACARVCPSRLMPFAIDRAVIGGHPDICADYNAQQCIACGSCSYVCPAKRFLAARVSLARGTARRLNQQKATRKEAAQ